MWVTRLGLVVKIARLGVAGGLFLALLSVVPLSPARPSATASGSSSQTAKANGGHSQIGPGATVHLTSTKTPPSRSRATGSVIGRLPVVRSAMATSAAPRRAAAAPGVPQTSLPPLYTPPSVPSPTDLAAYEYTPLGSTATAENTSVTDEPSVSMGANNAFYTGNFYAASSTNEGETINYIDPATAFPSAYGGFCCDQRTIYIPGWNLTAWALLYNPDTANNNEVRLAVTSTASGLAANTWTYWDFTPADAQISQSGVSLDYPQLAYSSNDLYLTSNVLNPDGTIFASLVFRCPFSALASPSGGTVDCTNFWVGGDTFTPVDGATSTLYWADHLNNTTLQVFSWAESDEWFKVTSTNVVHAAFTPNSYSCPSPDGSDMCASDDWTIRGGWLSNGVLGFAWDAAQGTGGLGTFPYPYVHVVEIDTSSMSLIDEPVIWSSANAYAYASVAVNGEGDLGVTAAYAGGGTYPGSTVMVRDFVSNGAWQPLNLAEGTNGPPGNRWGDFLTVRAAGGNGLTWVAGAYTLQGSCSDNWGACSSVQPQFVWFGRQSNAPCIPTNVGGSPAGSSSSPYRIYLPVVSNGGCA